MKKLFSTRLSWKTVLAFLAAAAAVLCFLFVLQYELSVDGYYNARLAQSGPQVYLAKEFPHLEVSVFRKYFADKELIYHVVLDGIFRVQECLNMSLNPPFRLPLFLFLMAAVCAFFAACRRAGVRRELLLPGGLFFIFLCYPAAGRLFMLRSHVFSVALLFLAVWFLTGRRVNLKNCLILALISFLYSWSYSIPFFILIVPCAYAFFRCMRRGGAKEWLFPLSSALGVLAALILHPQYPWNLLVLWRQGFYAMFARSRGELAAYLAPAEMHGVTWNVLPYYLPLLLAVLAGIACMIYAACRERKYILNPELYASGGLALFFSAGIFFAVRSAEYALPFGVFFCIQIAEHCLRRIPEPKHVRYAFLVLCVLSIFSAAFCIRKISGLKQEFPEPENLCAFLRENIPAGYPVYNPVWGDFPRLYFYDPLHAWQWGIDPVLSLDTDPVKYELLVRTVHPSAPCPSQKEVLEKLGTQVAVVLYPGTAVAKHLHENGWKLLVQFMEPGREEGWIFYCPPPEAE